MKITVLGAHNTESRNTRHMTLLVDNILALDAGGLTSALTVQEQLKIKAVLITHHHYDHIRDIPALAMNLFLRSSQVDVYSHQAVIDNLGAHFLNGVIYPEYHQKPAGNPVLRLHVLQPSTEVVIEGYRVKPLAMNHSQPATGYQVISPDNRTLFYSGDTGGGLERVWKEIQPQVLFIEVTAPDKWEASMIEHKHLTPGVLKLELIKFREIRGYLPRIIAVHLNPQSEEEIAEQLKLAARSLQAEIEVAFEGMEVQI